MFFNTNVGFNISYFALLVIMMHKVMFKKFIIINCLSSLVIMSFNHILILETLSESMT